MLQTSHRNRTRRKAEMRTVLWVITIIVVLLVGIDKKAHSISEEEVADMLADSIASGILVEKSRPNPSTIVYEDQSGKETFTITFDQKKPCERPVIVSFSEGVQTFRPKSAVYLYEVLFGCGSTFAPDLASSSATAPPGTPHRGTGRSSGFIVLNQLDFLLFSFLTCLNGN